MRFQAGSVGSRDLPSRRRPGARRVSRSAAGELVNPNAWPKSGGKAHLLHDDRSSVSGCAQFDGWTISETSGVSLWAAAGC